MYRRHLKNAYTLDIFQGIGAGDKSSGRSGELKLSRRSSEEHTPFIVLDDLSRFSFVDMGKVWPGCIACICTLLLHHCSFEDDEWRLDGFFQNHRLLNLQGPLGTLWTRANCPSITLYTSPWWALWNSWGPFSSIPPNNSATYSKGTRHGTQICIISKR